MRISLVTHYYWRVYRRAKRGTFAYYSDWSSSLVSKTLPSAFAAILAGLLYWLYGGWEAVMSNIVIVLIASIGAFLLSALLRFLWNFVQAPAVLERVKTRHFKQEIAGRELPYNNVKPFGAKLLYDDSSPFRWRDDNGRVSYKVGVINTSRESIYGVEVFASDFWSMHGSPVRDILTQSLNKPFTVNPTSTPLKFIDVFQWDAENEELTIGAYNTPIKKRGEYALELYVSSQDASETQWMVVIRYLRGKLSVSCTDAANMDF